MTAPIGAVVALSVDLLADVGPGDIIQTQTGRRYRVLLVRVQKKGKTIGRQHLRCLVVEKNTEPDADDFTYAGVEGIRRQCRVHTIRWYERTPARHKKAAR